MLGFKPVGAEASAGVEGALQEVDRQLAAYQEAWDSLVDSWLVIRISDPQVCVCWVWLTRVFTLCRKFTYAAGGWKV